jgi:hypothetical protein
MSEDQLCARGKHDWERLDRSEFTSVSVLIEGGLVEIPIAEAFLPTHRCCLCGVCATIVVHEGNDLEGTLY